MNAPLNPDAMENPVTLTRNPKIKIILPVALAWAAIVVFLLFVWPTPYRYAGGKESPESIRVNRFTGKEQRYDAGRGAYIDRKTTPRNTSATGVGWRDGPADSDRTARGRGAKGKGWWYDNSSKSRQGGKGEQWWYKDDGKDRKSVPKDGWWHD